MCVSLKDNVGIVWSQSVSKLLFIWNRLFDWNQIHVSKVYSHWCLNSLSLNGKTWVWVGQAFNLSTLKKTNAVIHYFWQVDNRVVCPMSMWRQQLKSDLITNVLPICMLYLDYHSKRAVILCWWISHYSRVLCYFVGCQMSHAQDYHNIKISNTALPLKATHRSFAIPLHLS